MTRPPRPVMFIPCEKVGRDLLGASLHAIGIIESVTYDVPAGAIAQKNHRAPIKWAVVGGWIDGDPEVEYEQLTLLVGPGNVQHFSAVTSFRGQPLGQIHHVINFFPAFPVEEGLYELQAHFRVAGAEDSEAELVALWPIRVEHAFHAPAETEDATPPSEPSPPSSQSPSVS